MRSEGRRSRASARGAEWGQGLGSRPGRPEGALGAELARRRAGRGAPAAPSPVNAPTSGRAGLLPGEGVAVRKAFPGMPRNVRRFPGKCGPSDVALRGAGPRVSKGLGHWFSTTRPRCFRPAPATRSPTRPARPPWLGEAGASACAFHCVAKGQQTLRLWRCPDFPLGCFSKVH